MPIKNVTTSGTEVALTSTRSPCHRITIRAKSGNTGVIYVGWPAGVFSGSGSSVSTTVYDAFLAAGEAVTWGGGDAKGNDIAAGDVYLDASVSGEGVAFFLE